MLRKYTIFTINKFKKKFKTLGVKLPNYRLKTDFFLHFPPKFGLFGPLTPNIFDQNSSTYFKVKVEYFLTF